MHTNTISNEMKCLSLVLYGSTVNENEYLLVDDNNSHDGKGPKYAVFKRTAILVSKIDMDVTRQFHFKQAAQVVLVF